MEGESPIGPALISVALDTSGNIVHSSLVELTFYCREETDGQTDINQVIPRWPSRLRRETERQAVS